jgi:hypothetical protein
MAVTLESATNDLITAIDAVVDDWLVRCVVKVYESALGPVTAEVMSEAKIAATAGRAEVLSQLQAALTADVDAQKINPLQVLRNAVVFPTAVLAQFGVAPVERDEMDTRIMPADVYGLSPAHWNDVSETLLEPGIIWGAAKAQTVLQRRRAEGKLAES